MVRTFTSRFLCWATLASLAVAFAAVTQPALGADGPVRKTLSKRGRLPAHYAPVVDEKQREDIYKIQEEYRPKIEALETQLKALKKERDDKIAALLTAEQKKLVEAAKAKPAETAPAAPPVEKQPAK